MADFKKWLFGESEETPRDENNQQRNEPQSDYDRLYQDVRDASQPDPYLNEIYEQRNNARLDQHLGQVKQHIDDVGASLLHKVEGYFSQVERMDKALMSQTYNFDKMMLELERKGMSNQMLSNEIKIMLDKVRMEAEKSLRELEYAKKDINATAREYAMQLQNKNHMLETNQRANFAEQQKQLADITRKSIEAERNIELKLSQMRLHYMIQVGMSNRLVSLAEKIINALQNGRHFDEGDAKHQCDLLKIDIKSINDQKNQLRSFMNK